MTVVTLTDVTLNKSFTTAGSTPYKMHTVSYTNSQEKTVSPRIFPNSPAGRQLVELGVAAGDTVDLVYEKNEKGFFNIKSITKAEGTAEKALPAKRKYTAKSGYDNVGQQVGNAITNAVTTLGVGKTIDQYEARAIDIIQMGNRLRELIETGDITERTANSNEGEQAAQSYTIQTDDEPF
jgi:hypothetical protein